MINNGTLEPISTFSEFNILLGKQTFLYCLHVVNTTSWKKAVNSKSSLKVFHILYMYTWMEIQTTNQRKCNHGRWQEASNGHGIDKDWNA